VQLSRFAGQMWQDFGVQHPEASWATAS